jgi:urease accessory protein
VTLYVTGLLGRVDESRFAGRRVVPVLVAWDEASRRRLRRDASDGTDVAIDLEPGGYLADGTVLDDDGERVVVVQRPPERALVIRLDSDLPIARLVAQAVAVGHAFGNQHVPVDLDGGEVRVPLTTSEAIARATVEALSLEGAVVSVDEVALGMIGPLTGGRAHAHHH